MPLDINKLSKEERSALVEEYAYISEGLKKAKSASEIAELNLQLADFKKQFSTDQFRTISDAYREEKIGDIFDRNLPNRIKDIKNMELAKLRSVKSQVGVSVALGGAKTMAGLFSTLSANKRLKNLKLPAHPGTKSKSSLLSTRLSEAINSAKSDLTKEKAYTESLLNRTLEKGKNQARSLGLGSSGAAGQLMTIGTADAARKGEVDRERFRLSKEQRADSLLGKSLAEDDMNHAILLDKYKSDLSQHNRDQDYLRRVGGAGITNMFSGLNQIGDAIPAASVMKLMKKSNMGTSPLIQGEVNNRIGSLLDKTKTSGLEGKLMSPGYKTPLNNTTTGMSKDTGLQRLMLGLSTPENRTPENIAAFQTAAQQAGFKLPKSIIGGVADGRWGPETEEIWKNMLNQYQPSSLLK
jgi:hypothetical protein